MDPRLEQIVFAIQTATQELIDLAVSAGPNPSPSEAQEIEDEVHSTMLSLMAAAILSHGQFCPGEQAFLQIILSRPDASMTNERVVNEYSSRWASLANRMPAFLRRAAESDHRNGTRSARAMLVHIQTIGNNAAIADGDFVPCENLLVRNYIASLENHIDGFTTRRG